MTGTLRARICKTRVVNMISQRFVTNPVSIPDPVCKREIEDGSTYIHAVIPTSSNSRRNNLMIILRVLIFVGSSLTVIAMSSQCFGSVVSFLDPPSTDATKSHIIPAPTNIDDDVRLVSLEKEKREDEGSDVNGSTTVRVQVAIRETMKTTAISKLDSHGNDESHFINRNKNHRWAVSLEEITKQSEIDPFHLEETLQFNEECTSIEPTSKADRKSVV